MKKTRYYSVDELKLMGTYGAGQPVSNSVLESQLGGQLTIFKPILITKDGQMSIASTFPKNTKSLKKLMKTNEKRDR